MIYGYIAKQEQEADHHTAIKEINTYSKNHSLNLEKLIEDPQTNKVRWDRRLIFDLIHQTALPGQDTLVVYDAIALGRSISQVLEIFHILVDRNISLHIVKYDYHFKAEAKSNACQLLHLLRLIENDFVAKRTSDALARRRAAGLPLGRPKGRLNRQLKLDKYRPEIQHYLNLHVSKASIAKLIGCHAQTLYNYVEARQLKPQAEGTAPEGVTLSEVKEKLAFA